MDLVVSSIERSLRFYRGLLEPVGPSAQRGDLSVLEKCPANSAPLTRGVHGDFVDHEALVVDVEDDQADHLSRAVGDGDSVARTTWA